MSTKTTKAQKKSKPAKNPVKVNITVRDCMTWHYPEGYKPERDTSNVSGSPQKDFYLPKKADIGQAKDHGYELPPGGVQIRPRDSDGRVIDALRGWPQNGEEPPEGQTTTTGNLDQQPDAADRKGDPWMGDLIAHKFLAEATRRRREEEADSKKAAAGRSKKSSRSRTDIKANRTSQLRSIALAEKVEVSPHELWQMSKFKRNARPHLSTLSRRQGRQAASGSDVRQTEDVAGGEPCTCYDDRDVVAHTNDVTESHDNVPTPERQYDGHVDANMDFAYGDENDDSKLFAV